ncbi:terminase family protein [Acidobacteria bacterium AH-259-G07]|nr:terminase family protein [Acidobacteria bacterium AH-259-G07]
MNLNKQKALVENWPPLAAIEQEKDRRARNKIQSYYPDAGPLRRELYPKHLSFFAAGKKHRERAFIAANKIGKTEGVGGYEITCHMTGRYPSWWPGRKFDHPVNVWACGDTSKSVREILQDKMLGPMGNFGIGMIPADSIVHTVAKAGVADAVELVYIRHATGKNSVLTFKSYDQRREAFQGTDMDIIWLDEEPPMNIYAECLLRTMVSNGLVLLTFTPLLGLTELVLSFLPGGRLQENAS